MAVKLKKSAVLHSPAPSQTPRSPREQNLEESVQRGTRWLATLAHAARAARLEAEVAELEAALAEAHGGAGRRLERWLSKFDAADDDLSRPAYAQPLGPVSIEAASLATAAFASMSPAGSPSIDCTSAQGMEGRSRGWAPYLVHARQRLRELEQPRPHAILEQASQPGGAVAELANAIASAPASEIEPIATDELLPEDFGDTELGPSPIADAGEVLDLSLIERPADATQPAPPASRPMLGSLSLSLVAHVGLLAILFMITLKLPGESASLGSQIVSVAAAMEDVEFSSEVTELEPVEMQLDATVEPSHDPASAAASAAPALADIEAAATEASSLLGAMSAASTGQSSGAMLSAAVGRQAGHGASGRGSARGAPAMSTSGGRFFGAGAGGNFFCYVVDSSGSMRGKAWESAKTELLRSISTLTEKQRFYIVFFAREIAAIPEPGSREPASHGLAATKENIEHARRWIETVKLDRGGPPNDALELAIAREPDAIYLLTDGVTQVDVCAFLRECNRTSDIISGQQVRVPIHAIAYHSLDGQQLLRRLAQENSGQFHCVPPP